MLNIFTLVNGRLFQEEIESLEELSRFQPIWVDLESPTLEEKRWIKQYFGLSIPEDAMDEDIEESARFYEEDNGELHIRSDFLIADDDERRETEPPAALHHLGDAVDVDELVDELAVPLFTVVTVLAVTALRTFLSHIAFRLSFAGD